MKMHKRKSQQQKQFHNFSVYSVSFKINFKLSIAILIAEFKPANSIVTTAFNTQHLCIRTHNNHMPEKMEIFSATIFFSIQF